MKSLKIHIVYEYGSDLRPHPSSYIRLIRPLTHPSLYESLDVTFGPRVTQYPVEAVIVDRLWRPDITPMLAKQLVYDIHNLGARFIFALDDNLLDLPQERHDWPQERHLAALHIFLQHSDVVWVTTNALKERLSSYPQPIFVIPNALDERLVTPGRWTTSVSPFNETRFKIGFMGTMTHDTDLLMIAPALQKLSQQYPKAFELQIIGGIQQKNSLEALRGITVKYFSPPPEEQEYPLFMLWLMSQFNWEIALAPLVDTPFNSCKSDIKFLDYCALGAAGIYSRVAAYKTNIKDLETGWLVQNQVEIWYQALEALLTDNELRKQLVHNARRYLFAERTLAQCARSWLEATIASVA